MAHLIQFTITPKVQLHSDTKLYTTTALALGGRSNATDEVSFLPLNANTKMLAVISGYIKSLIIVTKEKVNNKENLANCILIQLYSKEHPIKFDDFFFEISQQVKSTILEAYLMDFMKIN